MNGFCKERKSALTPWKSQAHHNSAGIFIVKTNANIDKCGNGVFSMPKTIEFFLCSFEFCSACP